MARVHPDVGHDFRRLLRLLESSAFGAFQAGSPRPFTQAPPAEQTARLEGWRTSRLDLLRSGYQAVKRLAHASYYASPETYARVGYPGPARRPTTPGGQVSGQATAPGRIHTGAEISRPPRSKSTSSSWGPAPAAAPPPPCWPAAGAKVAVWKRAATTRAATSTCRRAGPTPPSTRSTATARPTTCRSWSCKGRSVGGGTTVNWTSSFRTPERTLALWASRHGVRGLDAAALAPHFEAAEAAAEHRRRQPRRRQRQQPQAAGGRGASWAGSPS